jgi:hypothetical protein
MNLVEEQQQQDTQAPKLPVTLTSEQFSDTDLESIMLHIQRNEDQYQDDEDYKYLVRIRTILLQQAPSLFGSFGMACCGRYDKPRFRMYYKDPNYEMAHKIYEYVKSKVDKYDVDFELHQIHYAIVK